MWMMLPGISPSVRAVAVPMRVPKKKYLKGRPTMGADTLMDTFGTRGVKRRKRM